MIRHSKACVMMLGAAVLCCLSCMRILCAVAANKYARRSGDPGNIGIEKCFSVRLYWDHGPALGSSVSAGLSDAPLANSGLVFLLHR